MGGGKNAAGGVAQAVIYTGGRVATNALTIAQAFATALAQIGAMKWMIDRQESMWDHVAAKQIACVEVALNNYILEVDNLLPTFRDAYPDIPVAARYVAVDTQVEQFNQMVANINNLPKSAEYMIAANHWHQINYKARLELLSPGFTASLARHLRQTESLMSGQLPPDELVALTTSEAENAAATGKLGATRVSTARMLGVRKLQMQHLGREELERHVNMLEKISPVGTEVTLDSLMIRPESRLQLALQQAQLLQNDLQNANNAAAQKHPALMAQLQTKLQKIVAVLSYQANKANMQNQFVPNFPGLFGPTIANLTKTVTNEIFGMDHDAHIGGDLSPPGSTAVTV